MIQVSTATDFRMEQNIIYFAQVCKIQHFPLLIELRNLFIEIVRLLATFNTDEIENCLTYLGMNF